MSTKMVRQTRFSLGEVDVVNYKRTDIEGYLTAAQSLLNMEVGTTQLAKKRRGTRNAFFDTGEPTNVDAYAIDESQMYEYIDKFGNYYLILSNDAANGWNVFSVDLVTGDLTFHQNVPSTQYPAATLFNVDYALDSDSLVLVNGGGSTGTGYPPARIYIDNYGTNNFSYQQFFTTSVSGPLYPLPAYDFQQVNYAGFITISFTNPTVYTFSVILQENIPGEAAKFTNDWIGGQIVSFGSATSVTRPIGYGIITAVSHPGAGQVQFDGNVYIPFDTAANMTNLLGSQYSIRQPVWSTTFGYPSSIAFYQNRLWMGCTLAQPTTIYGSRINQPINYDVGVGNDADAIIYNIGQTGTGDILWINGGKQLEIYTENFEFACPQDPSVGLTPGTFSVRQQSSYGASRDMKPVTYLNDSYFATRGGGAIVNFHFDGVGLSYTSTNISLASQHLISNPINRALQRSETANQDNFIYFLNDYTITNVSQVTSFQFVTETKLAAFTPVEFEQNVTVLDVVNINNRIYFLKKYPLTGSYFIEIFDETVFEDLVELKTAAVFTPGELGVVTGLQDFEGYNVNFFTIGTYLGLPYTQDYGASLDATGQPAPVTGGQAYFDNLNDYVGDIYVGIPYNVLIRPMYLFSGQAQSNFYKNIKRIFVDYYQSLDFQVNGYQVPYQSFPAIQFGVPLLPETDTAVVESVDGWARFSTFDITQSSPFDLQITAIAYQIDSQII